MGENFRKRFAGFFCLLLLLQETHGLLKNHQSDTKWKRQNLKSGDDEIETKVISAVNSRRKRGILNLLFDLIYFNTAPLKNVQSKLSKQR